MSKFTTRSGYPLEGPEKRNTQGLKTLTIALALGVAALAVKLSTSPEEGMKTINPHDVIKQFEGRGELSREILIGGGSRYKAIGFQMVHTADRCIVNIDGVNYSVLGGEEEIAQLISELSK